MENQDLEKLFETLHYLPTYLYTYIFFKDRKHQLMALNEAAAKDLSTTIPDALGKSNYDFIPLHLARRNQEEENDAGNVIGIAGRINRDLN